MLSTTIKKVFMDRILSGEKKVEYKENTRYWQDRIKGDATVINFLCGQKFYKYKINRIRCIKTPRGVRTVIKTSYCFAIELGERLQ